MGNLVSHMAWVPRGGEIIAEAGSHVSWDEGAGHAVISGASLRPVKARRDGTLDEQEVEDLIFDDADPHLAPTALLVLENTHAVSGGQPLPVDYVDRMSALAHGHGLRVHVDGARLFNAVVASATPASRLLRDVDSATFCLSKGLACPVGSLVVGPRDFIWRARRARKMVGGGMRQVGILAAAGLIALREGPSGMIDRLAEDHRNARRLAEALGAMPGIGHLDPGWVRTNFVLFAVMHPGQDRDGRPDPALRAAFVERCAQDGLLLVNYPNGEIRACTHYGVEPRHIDRTIEIVRAALTDVGAAPVTSVAGAGR
jgi:threonine aldolase